MKNALRSTSLPICVGVSFACVSCLSTLSQAVAPIPSQFSTRAAKAAAPEIQADYGKLPLSFEINQGQSDPQVRFLARGQGYSLFLTDSAAILALSKGNPPSKKLGPKATPETAAKPETLNTDVVRMELAAANSHPRSLEQSSCRGE